MSPRGPGPKQIEVQEARRQAWGKTMCFLAGYNGTRKPWTGAIKVQKEQKEGSVKLVKSDSSEEA